MPAWIHDRAMRLKPEMEKQYGKEKGEQVAFAVATQMAHKLGKSPKKFGTPEGRAMARNKFDKPRKEYRKTAADLMEEWKQLADGSDALKKTDTDKRTALKDLFASTYKPNSIESATIDLGKIAALKEFLPSFVYELDKIAKSITVAQAKKLFGHKMRKINKSDFTKRVPANPIPGQ